MGQRHSKQKIPTNPLEKQQLRKKRKEQEKKKQQELLKKTEEKKLKDAKKKSGKKSTDNKQQQTNLNQNENEYNLTDIQNLDYNQTALEKLRKQLNSDISSFILNQIILSVQFFGNFEIEKNAAVQNLKKKENELSQKMEHFSIILPNIIDDAVEKRIKFQAKHGPKKHMLYPLQLQTVYVVCESIQVYDPNYAQVQPVCRVDIDTSTIVGEDKVRKGYVRLILRDNSKAISECKSPRLSNESVQNDEIQTHKKSTSSADSIYANGSITTADATYESLKQNQLKILQKQQKSNYDKINKNSEYSDTTSAYVSSSEIEYEYVTNLNTHQPLNVNAFTSIVDNHQPIANNFALPEYCLSDDDFSSYDVDDTDSDDEDRRNNVKYINSKKFFSYFMLLFKDHIAKDLNIHETELNSATWKCSSIFTSSHEIIPAIHIPNWPSCANEWILRSRSNYINPNNGKLIQWPTPEMIKEIIDYGCYIIPQGYIHKYEHNSTRELEWKIVFPKAEKYLELCLTNTQIKIFMICKTIIKTYIENTRSNNLHYDGMYMFTIEHLRTHLFWECERYYLACNDEYLGEILIRFLKSFARRLSRKCLPDYFIRDRNLFEYIPDRYKNELLILITNIIQNPVIYLIKTLKNLQQVELFYPKFNYNMLYTCIVTDNLIKLIKQLKCCIKSNQLDTILMNQEQQQQEQSQIEVDECENLNHKKIHMTNNSDSECDKGGLISQFDKKEKLDENKRRRTKKLKLKEARKLKKRIESNMEKRNSDDSIDLTFIVPENLGKIQRSMKIEANSNFRSILDDMRTVLIIEIFIKHFIHMSKSMFVFKSYDQIKIYLNHSKRLTNLLIDYDYTNHAKKYLNDIENLENILIDDTNNETISNHLSSMRNCVPELPARTSIQTNNESFKINHSYFLNLQRQSSRVQFIEPRDLSNEGRQSSSSPNKGQTSRPTSIKFIEPVSYEIRADVHSTSPNTSNSEPKSILKDTNIKQNESNFELQSNVELRNADESNDRVQTKITSIILAKTYEDDIEEISESTEL